MPSVITEDSDGTWMPTFTAQFFKTYVPIIYLGPSLEVFSLSIRPNTVSKPNILASSSCTFQHGHIWPIFGQYFNIRFWVFQHVSNKNGSCFWCQKCAVFL